MGSAKSREAAREIFDRELVQIQNINDFAGAVGRVLGEVMTHRGRKKVAFSVSPMAYKAHILITKASGVNV